MEMQAFDRSLAASLPPPMLSYQEPFDITCQLIQSLCKVRNPSESLPKLWERKRPLTSHTYGAGFILRTLLVAA